MIRVVKMAGKFYGVEIDFEDDGEQENIQTFIEEGNVVILGEDVECVAEILNINSSQIEMVY